MFELVKKSMLLSMGALDLTRERIEGFVDELIERGELAQEERGTEVEELFKGAKKHEKKFTERIRNVMEKTVTELGLPTKRDLEGIENRLDSLEKRLVEKE